MMDWNADATSLASDIQLLSDTLENDDTQIIEPGSAHLIKDIYTTLDAASNCCDALEHLEQHFIHLREETLNSLEDIEAQINKLNSKKNLKSTTTYCRWPHVFGIPYFKGNDFFPAPLNRDAIDMSKKDYVTDLTLPLLHRWKEQDKRNLFKAVMRETEILRNQAKTWYSKHTAVKGSIGLKNTLCDTLDSDYFMEIQKIDWMKISTVDLKERHNVNECIAMWYSYLHPSLNKKKWNKKEEERLKQLAEKYNSQDWEKIARELGTNRSAYQCMHHLQTHLNKYVQKKKWTKEENKKLRELVEHFQLGNFIPWNKVASCMEGRTKFQIYNHWTYTLQPSIQKGRFTKKEDAIVVKGFLKYGADFGRISRLLPNRTSIQVRNRYNTFLQYQKPVKQWSAEEDQKLFNLVNEMGKGKWSEISKLFHNRNRTQLRHRYAAIEKWMKRNPGKPLKMRNRKICRKYQGPQKMLEELESNVITDEPCNRKQVDHKQAHRPNNTKTDDSRIDQELTSYFQFGVKQFRNSSQVHYSKSEAITFAEKLKIQLTLLFTSLNIDLPLKRGTLLKTDRKLFRLLKKEYSQQNREKNKKLGNRDSKFTKKALKVSGAQSSSRQASDKTYFCFPPNYSTLSAFKTLSSFCKHLENKMQLPQNETSIGESKSTEPADERNSNKKRKNDHVKPSFSSSDSQNLDVNISLWKQRLLSLFMWPKIMSENDPCNLDIAA